MHYMPFTMLHKASYFFYGLHSGEVTILWLEASMQGHKNFNRRFIKNVEQAHLLCKYIWDIFNAQMVSYVWIGVYPWVCLLLHPAGQIGSFFVRLFSTVLHLSFLRPFSQMTLSKSTTSHDAVLCSILGLCPEMCWCVWVGRQCLYVCMWGIEKTVRHKVGKKWTD